MKTVSQQIHDLFEGKTKQELEVIRASFNLARRICEEYPTLPGYHHARDFRAIAMTADTLCQ